MKISYIMLLAKNSPANNTKIFIDAKSNQDLPKRIAVRFPLLWTHKILLNFPVLFQRFVS